MRPQLRPGTIVLHPEFGSGTVVSNDGERLEVDFKLRGRKKLLTNAAKQVMTESGYKPPVQPTPEAVAAAHTAKQAQLAKRKAKAKAKAAKRKKKHGKSKAKRTGIQLGSRSGRAGGDKWEWDMTTPKTRLWREGKR